MTDAEIVEMRDRFLPSQGERFDCIAFARAILAAAPALPQEWIPVSERLPGEDLSLWLVCLRDTSVRVDMWITGGASGWSQYGDDVTHWMPLPPPPSLPTGDKT